MTRSPRAFIVGLALLSGMVAAAGRARAQPLGIVEHPELRQDAWQGTIGVRGTLIKSAGYDPFSTNDGLTQLSLSLSRVVWREPSFALAVGFGLDSGSTEATARGAPSELDLTRWSALLEGRYAPHPRGYGFVRLAPGILRADASVRDDSAPAGAPLVDNFNTFSMDASAGAAVCLNGRDGKIGAWLLAEGGYGWSASHSLLLAPDLGSRDQSKAGALDLGAIALRGGFVRLSFALTY